jgi:hypothetical protein
MWLETLDKRLKRLKRELPLFRCGQGGPANDPCGCVALQTKGQESTTLLLAQTARSRSRQSIVQLANVSL